MGDAFKFSGSWTIIDNVMEEEIQVHDLRLKNLYIVFLNT